MNIRQPVYWASGIMLGAFLIGGAWFIHRVHSIELIPLMKCVADASDPTVQWVCKQGVYFLRMSAGDVKELNRIAGTSFAVNLADKEEAEKMLKFFLSRGVDINSIGTRITNAGLTALHNAVHANELREVELLLVHGANTNVLSDRNQTPLELARELQHSHPHEDRSQVIKLLVESGRPKYSGFVRYHN